MKEGSECEIMGRKYGFVDFATIAVETIIF